MRFRKGNHEMYQQMLLVMKRYSKVTLVMVPERSPRLSLYGCIHMKAIMLARTVETSSSGTRYSIILSEELLALVLLKPFRTPHPPFSDFDGPW
ncbi:hypothetical protein KCU61_g213, partial [Aureobasidium melanogenum]